MQVSKNHTVRCKTSHCSFLSVLVLVVLPALVMLQRVENTRVFLGRDWYGVIYLWMERVQ
jgi:hypothetical protein